MKFHVHRDVIEKATKDMRWGVGSLLWRMMSEAIGEVPQEMTDTGWRATPLVSQRDRTTHLLWGRKGDPPIKTIKNFAPDDFVLRTIGEPSRHQADTIRYADFERDFKGLDASLLIHHPVLGLSRDQQIEDLLADESTTTAVLGPPGAGISTVLEMLAVSRSSSTLYLTRTPNLALRVKRLCSNTKRSNLRVVDFSQFFRELAGLLDSSDAQPTETLETGYQEFLGLTRNHEDIQQALGDAEPRAVYLLIARALTAYAVPFSVGYLSERTVPVISRDELEILCPNDSADDLDRALEVSRILHARGLLKHVRRDHCRAFDAVLQSHGRDPRHLADTVIIDDAQDLTLSQLAAAVSVARKSVVIGHQTSVIMDSEWWSHVRIILGDPKVTMLGAQPGRPAGPTIFGGLGLASTRTPWNTIHLPEIVCVTGATEDDERWIREWARASQNRVNIAWPMDSRHQGHDLASADTVRGQNYDYAVVWGADDTMLKLLTNSSLQPEESLATATLRAREDFNRLATILTRARETTVILVAEPEKMPSGSCWADENRHEIPTFSCNVIVPHLQEPTMDATSRARVSCDIASSLLARISPRLANDSTEEVLLARDHLALASWMLPSIKESPDRSSLRNQIMELDTAARLFLSWYGDEDFDEFVSEQSDRPPHLQELLDAIVEARDWEGESTGLSILRALLEMISRQPVILKNTAALYFSSWAQAVENMLSDDTILALINAGKRTDLPDMCKITQTELERRAQSLQERNRNDDAYTLWRRVDGREREATSCLVALRRFEEAARSFEALNESDLAIDAWRHVPKPEEALRVARHSQSPLAEVLETISRLQHALSPQIAARLTDAEKRELLRLLRK